MNLKIFLGYVAPLLLCIASVVAITAGDHTAVAIYICSLWLGTIILDVRSSGGDQ